MHKMLKIACVGSLLLGVTACSNNNETYDSMTWKTTAQKFSQFEELHFAPKAGQLNAHQDKTLHALLVQANKPSQVYAVISQNVPISHGKTGVHHARAQSIIKFLRNHGVALHRIDVTYGTPASLAAQKAVDRNRVTVTIDQYALQAPSCPGWNEPMDPYADVMGDHQFGCSTERNFAAMVAEPRDVYEAQKTGDGDGTLHSLRVRNYQQGIQRPLIIESAKADGGKAEQSTISNATQTASTQGQ